MTDCDIIIIGSGPAGMAAATIAATYGASITLLDEQDQPGGQIYRGIANNSDQLKTILGQDYRYGESLLEKLSSANINHIGNATVWAVDEDGVVTYSQLQSAKSIKAKQIIIATGALERSYPLPGWTTPGVMTVGAAQILLKSSHMVLENAVLAGTGPLLYTVAAQFIKAGAPPRAIVDTITARNYRQAARYFPFSQLATINKGLSYIRQIKKTGVPFYRGATDIRITGGDQVKEIRFTCKGTSHRIDTDNVLLHQGVVPNTQLSRSLRLDHQWHSEQHCFHPVVDQWGLSSTGNIRVAGDGSGIGGALLAESQGNLVAIAALHSLELITTKQRNTLAAPFKKQLSASKKLRQFLDILYTPPTAALTPADNTIVCRCEEVTAGDIRSYAKLGCTGPNQTKAFGRCGMGPCQGRYCGLTVTEILAHENDLSHNEIGAYRIRSPVKPVTLAELASLNQPGDIPSTE